MRTRKKKNSEDNSFLTRSVKNQNSFFSSPSSFGLQTSKVKNKRSLADVETQLQRARESNFNFANIPLLSPLQRKTTMGELGDKYERDADNAGLQFTRSIQHNNSLDTSKQTESIQPKNITSLESQPQRKEDENNSNSNVSSQFWQNNLLQPSLQKKSLPQTKTNSLQRKVNWDKWKRRVGIGVGGGTVAGSLGYGAGVGISAGVSALAGSGAVKAGLLATGGVLAGMGPIGWGILAGAGGLAALGGLGYLGYKAYKRYKQGKQRSKNAIKAATEKDLQKGDILLFGGSAQVNAGQAAASALRGFAKLATLQLRGGIRDLTTRMVDTSVGHAGIYVGNGTIAHATNDGFVLGNLNYGDPAWVYRSSDTSFTEEVSEMARRWAGQPIKYSETTAFTSAFTQSKFGKKGHIRAVRLALHNCFYEAQKRLGFQTYQSRSWGATGIAGHELVPDSLICSEASISIYQAVAYKEKVKEIFDRQKQDIMNNLQGDNPQTFDQIVRGIAAQISPEEIDKYKTLHLDAGKSTPQRLSAKLDKWSLNPDKTGWTYIGLFDPVEDERVKKEDRQRQIEEHRQRVEKLKKEQAETKEQPTGKAASILG